MTGIAPPPWHELRRRILAEPFIVFGMTLRLARPDEAEALAPLLATALPRLRGQLPAEAVMRHLCREGVAYRVEDDEHRPMGLASIRDAGDGGAGIGWALAPERLGKGLGAILAEGVADRLFRCGAAFVTIPVPPASRPAQRAVEALGFTCRDAAARPLVYAAGPGEFAARRRRGTALLPTAAERRRGPSPGEQGIVAGEPDRLPGPVAAAVVRRAFARPHPGDGPTIRPASARELASPEGLAHMPPDLAAVPRGAALLVAEDAAGEPFGSVLAAPLPNGTIELGFLVAPRRRGEGLSGPMVRRAAEALFAAGAGRLSSPQEDAASFATARGIGFAPPGRGARGLSLDRGSLASAPGPAPAP